MAAGLVLPRAERLVRRWANNELELRHRSETSAGS